ncbi:succinic semialdehyde dehydrogenase [Kribbia dieselivorans]|uniref:succinic semialdehyde dehydrogenase n=1 Tax=Kribbia dieselivorans TaxID=331526 RepID=UPI000837C2FD|nr:succinic semialdehyde dehydrogenase [Kribbia dieselivorans]
MSSEAIADPMIDRSATLLVDPAVCRRLTARVVSSRSAPNLTTNSPLTGGAIGDLPASTIDDVDRAFATARAAQPRWAATSIADRTAILLRLHDIMLDRQRELLDLCQIETGKTRMHAFEELGSVAVVARYYARTATAHLRPQRRRGVYPVLTQVTEYHHPVGVVGIVSPWNYPLAMAFEDALPALAAGNSVVLRPDPQGTLTALALAECLDDAGLPEGVLQVVAGGAEIGAAVLDRGDVVGFTGSTATGRKVAESVAGRLVGYSLELGGKNTLYVADDADLDKAVPGAVRAVFASAGQTCIAIERIAVHTAVAQEFTARFVAAVKEMRVSVDLAFGPDMGSLVSQRQLDTFREHLSDAQAKGATVLAGGRELPEIGPFCVEPTVLADVTPDMICYGHETFGPLVSLHVVPSDEGAIAFANDTDYGLNASVWTRDTRRGKDIATRIQTGTVNVNEGYASAHGSIDAPMGGMKASGVGRRHGQQGIHKYTESQTVAVQHLVSYGPVFGMSQERFAATFTGGMRALKKARLK